MDEERTAKCESCGFSGTLDDFDVCGSCPGNLFCNECGTEFVVQTGEPSLLCGVCTGCKWLKEDDEWESVQADRHEDLGKFKHRSLHSGNQYQDNKQRPD